MEGKLIFTVRTVVYLQKTANKQCKSDCLRKYLHARFAINPPVMYAILKFIIINVIMQIQISSRISRWQARKLIVSVIRNTLVRLHIYIYLRIVLCFIAVYHVIYDR